MYVQPLALNSFSKNTPRTPGNSLPARNERRERDFGTGYGRSSGYAAARSYAGNTGMRTFRFA